MIMRSPRKRPVSWRSRIQGIAKWLVPFVALEWYPEQRRPDGGNQEEEGEWQKEALHRALAQP